MNNLHVTQLHTAWFLWAAACSECLSTIKSLYIEETGVLKCVLEIYIYILSYSGNGSAVTSGPQSLHAYITPEEDLHQGRDRITTSQVPTINMEPHIL